ncbi:MAG: phage holin [Tissierellia bacterium]|nr:phage holin [Tissierellia bacterium]
MTIQTDLLLKIALAVLTIISALVTGLLIPYLRGKIKAEDRKKILTIVKYAVMAAEQLFNESGQGEIKKQYVIEYLAKQGFKLNTDELDMLIESAVKELNLWQAEFNRE